MLRRLTLASWLCGAGASRAGIPRSISIRAATRARRVLDTYTHDTALIRSSKTPRLDIGLLRSDDPDRLTIGIDRQSEWCRLKRKDIPDAAT